MSVPLSVLLFRAVFMLIGRFVALVVQLFLTNRLLVVRVKENGFSNPFILKTRTGMSVLLFLFLFMLIGRCVALVVQPFLTNRLLVVRVLQSGRYHRFCYTPAAPGPCLE